MNIKEYWKDIDSRLEKLIEVGYVKLPSLSEYDLDFLASDVSNEMGTLTFKELGSNHKKFLDELKFDKYLTDSPNLRFWVFPCISFLLSLNPFVFDILICLSKVFEWM